MTPKFVQVAQPHRFGAYRKGSPPTVIRNESLKPIEKWPLGWNDLCTGLRKGKPFCPIDLGERLPAMSMWRPFHFKWLAHQARDGKVAFHRESGDEFAASLTDLTERVKLGR